MVYKTHLKEIRNKLASQRLSLLAGAGLSMNVSPMFVTWENLLIDLAYELHQSAIDTAYDEHVKSNVIPRIEQKEFITARCKDHIRNTGYLEIVSAYIKYKGYTESITTYIEDRIPHVFAKDGKYFLELNGTTEELPRENMRLHRSLIDLPWNNVYTTNYDDLFDICIDRNRYDSLKNEITNLDKEIQNIENKILKIDKGIEKLSLNDYESRQTGSNDAALEDQPESEKKSKEPIDQNKANLNFQKNMLKNTLLKHETLRLAKETELYDCYQVVKSADGLRIKKQRNIIKLHGSLRSSEDRSNFNYEFDGDHRNQYIIAKEDYENYPNRHEAFTQLMRISLLQESFCLLGFSGVDHNFREWIKWVRDILHKAARNNRHGHEYKIYLVDASDKAITNDLQLFYENHNILRIPLLDPDVISTIQSDLGKPIAMTNRREALEAFVLYLNNDEGIKVDIPSENVSLRSEYRQIWDSINLYDPKRIPGIGEVLAVTEKLDLIHHAIWLPNLDYSAIHNQESIIDNCMMGWDELLDARPDIAILIRYAVEDMFVPIQNLVGENVIQKLLDNKYTASATQRMLDRTAALSAKLNVTFPEVHDQILQLAYSFQFTALSKLITNANLHGKDQIIAAGFLAIIDTPRSVQHLEHVLWEEELGRGEQMLYGLELLNFLTQPRLYGNDIRIARLINAFERSGFKLLQDEIDRLTKQIAEKRDSPKPYGSDRFSSSRTMHFTKDSDARVAIQMLMLLAESGFQLTVGGVYTQSHDAWYPVLKAGFRFYPEAFLFYALQYSNKDFLKKVGQDYAFSKSETVINAIPQICEALFRCLLDAPVRIKEHIPDFLSGLLVGVSPTVWQFQFGIWWQHLIDNDLAFKKDHTMRHPSLINAAILYIDDPELLIKIICDCLQFVAAGGQEDQAITILYYLNRNIHFKTLSPSHEQFEEINGSLDAVIGQLSSQKIDLIFIMGNIFRLLEDRQKTLIREKLKTIDLKEVDGSRVWRIIVYFSKGDDILTTHIQEALVAHRLLWHTGINGNGMSRGGKDEFIQLTAFTAPAPMADGFKWSDANIHLIYEKMLFPLSEIQRIGIRDRWFNFTNELEEMSKFLELFEPQLKSFDSYKEVCNSVQKSLEDNRNYTDLEDGLTSREASEVINALAQLSGRIYQNRIETFLINLVLNKILLQAEPALEETINYVSVWVADKSYPDRFKSYEALLLRILKKYDVDELVDSDEAFVQENLVRITWRLSTWGANDTIIQTWLERGRKSKFNNVIQFMAQAEIPVSSNEE